MSRAKLIDKIKKLFALAKKNSNRAEAEAAVVKARQLLAKHGISESEIDASKREFVIRTVSVDHKKLLKWEYFLGSMIGVNFCTRAVSTGYYEMGFMGREADSEVSAHVFEFLHRMAVELANKHIEHLKESVEWQFFDRKQKNAERKTFYLGFIMGVNKKLAIQREREQEEGLVYVEPGGLNEKVDEVTDRKREFKTEDELRGSRYSYMSGYKKGEKVEIHKPIAGGS